MCAGEICKQVSGQMLRVDQALAQAHAVDENAFIMSTKIFGLLVFGEVARKVKLCA